VPRTGLTRVDAAESTIRPHSPRHFETRDGVFMTGPSTIADIDGALTHGVQGIRSLTVILLAE
jgi:hypothetical protein